jgi:hypothetical protein
MGEVRRYELKCVGQAYLQSREMREDPDGDWVRYEDHSSELAARGARITELERQLQVEIRTAGKIVAEEQTLALRERVRELVSKLETLEGEQSVVRESLLAVLAHDTSEDLSTRPIAYLAGRVEALVERQRPIVDAAVSAAKASFDAAASSAKEELDGHYERQVTR